MAKYMLRYTFLAFLLFVTSLFFLSFVAGGDVLNVEANILTSADGEEIIRITVPDYINLGDVRDGGKSTEVTLGVNNTGNVDVTVRPILSNSSEEIFSYLFFRDQKTKTINGTITDVPFEIIGQFSFNVSKSGARKNDVYMILDLTNFPRSIEQNMTGHRADVKFLASKV